MAVPPARGPRWPGLFILVLLGPLMAGCMTSDGDSGPTSPAGGSPTGPGGGTTTSPAGTSGSPSPSGPAAPDEATVEVGDFAFDPKTTPIAQGGTVTWDWASGSHTVTIHRAGAANGEYVYDQTIDLVNPERSFTFNQDGTYHVFCKPHSSGEQGDYTSGMVSTVTVR